MAEKKPDPAINFSCVGGLQDQIQSIKEMVLFPLIYKEVFDKYKAKPARGALFHGPPGTGKTLMASALASECSLLGGRKVTFISRKGADILGSFVGESEMRLRQVFERARMFSPSIIFFDEIDALAPARDGLGRGNHVHTSIVSVLLTEMDGVGTAGYDVFVIGATNRIDAIDPALRRPGRFDRELRFSLPNCKERADILRVHTAQWKPRPPEGLVTTLATGLHGYCGSDLQAICAEALMCCIRRTNPDMAQYARKLRLNLAQVVVLKEDFASAQRKFVPAAHRMVDTRARCLPVRMEPLFRPTMDAVVAGLQSYEFLQPGGPVQGTWRGGKVPRLLLTGGADEGHTCHLAPAILHHFEHLPVVTIDVAVLCSGASYCAEGACDKAVQRVKSSLPAVLYLPDITAWWDHVSSTTRLTFISLLRGLHADTAMLMLATSHHRFADMPHELRDLFVEAREVVALNSPSAAQREKFFAQLIFGEAPGPGAPKSAPRSAPGSAREATPDRAPGSGKNSGGGNGRNRGSNNGKTSGGNCGRPKSPSPGSGEDGGKAMPEPKCWPGRPRKGSPSTHSGQVVDKDAPERRRQPARRCKAPASTKSRRKGSPSSESGEDDDKTTPKSKRRAGRPRKRSSSSERESDDDETTAKPKRRPARRCKASVSTKSRREGSSSSESDEDDDKTTPKSKRRPGRPRKRSSSAERESDDDDDDDSMAKPKRRVGRKRKATPPPRPESSTRLLRSARNSGKSGSQHSCSELSPPPKKSRRSLSAKSSRTLLAELGNTEERRALLARLVAATDGFASLPLELAFGDLTSCFDCWRRHRNTQQLLSDLGKCVSAIEQDAVDRSTRRDDDSDSWPDLSYLK